MLYTLGDMRLVGCNFVMRELVSNNPHRMIVRGDLYIGEKTFYAKMAIYHHNKPSKLLDVLGETEEEAEKNLREVDEYMQNCMLLNINGITDMIRQRCTISIMSKAVMLLSLISMIVCFYRSVTCPHITSYRTGLIIFLMLFIFSEVSKPLLLRRTNK